MTGGTECPSLNLTRVGAVWGHATKTSGHARKRIPTWYRNDATAAGDGIPGIVAPAKRVTVAKGKRGVVGPPKPPKSDPSLRPYGHPNAFL